jgi:SutA RNAP-binding domain
MSDEDEDFDQEDEEEELSDVDDADEVVADGEADVEDDEEETVATPVSRARKVEPVEVHSTAARAALRDTIAADVEAFLARGGSIKKVAEDQRTDPPKKADSGYKRGSV